MSSLIFLPFLASSGAAAAPSPPSAGFVGRASLGSGGANVGQQLVREVAEGRGVVRMAVGCDHGPGPPWAGAHGGLSLHVVLQEALFVNLQMP